MTGGCASKATSCSRSSWRRSSAARQPSATSTSDLQFARTSGAEGGAELLCHSALGYVARLADRPLVRGTCLLGAAEALAQICPRRMKEVVAVETEGLVDGQRRSGPVDLGEGD